MVSCLIQHAVLTSTGPCWLDREWVFPWQVWFCSQFLLFSLLCWWLIPFNGLTESEWFHIILYCEVPAHSGTVCESLHVSLSVWPSSHSPCSHCGPVGMIVCEWFYYYAKSMCLLSSHCVHDADSLWVIHVRFSWHGFSYYLRPNHVDLVVCGWLYVVRPNWIPSHYPHDCSNLVGLTES